jgi:transcriptional regulator with XRE-family HTH domain
VDSYGARLRSLGERARALRIAADLQQKELAARAGITPGTVVRFEATGRASVENVLRIATALGADDAFEQLFAPPKYRSIDDALAEPAARARQRVRRRR